METDSEGRRDRKKERNKSRGDRDKEKKHFELENN